MQNPKQPNLLAKFSTMAIQLGVCIGVGAWGGKQLDIYFKNHKPVFTAILSLAGIGAGLYLVLKDFIKSKK